MQRFKTPAKIAQSLARYCPSPLRSVLDPAVGDGALLIPLLRGRQESHLEVTAIDIDPSVIKPLRAALSAFSRKVTLHRGDFLEWAERHGGSVLQFDCVIMNPPFSSKKETFRRVRDAVMGGSGVRSTAIEAGFVIAAVRMLRPGGRLLAILPPSVITSDSFVWLRKFLLSTGRIHTVHELPHFSFENVEARMYLLVFEKGGVASGLLLQNHDLDHSTNLPIEHTSLGGAYRMDFGFHDGLRRYTRLRSRSKLRWVALSGAADVLRGSRKTPVTDAAWVIHTTDFEGGFWYCNQSRHRCRRTSSVCARAGDILVKRVGRACSSSFGMVLGAVGGECTDCVLVVRPKLGVRTDRLLFAIRTLTAFPFLRPLLERGTGAAYMSKRGLECIEFPIDLYLRLPTIFGAYQRALSQKSLATMLRLEEEAKRELERLTQSVRRRRNLRNKSLTLNP